MALWEANHKFRQKWKNVEIYGLMKSSKFQTIFRGLINIPFMENSFPKSLDGF